MWAAHYEKILKAKEKRGEEIPDAILPPEIDSDLESVYEVFMVLSECRMVGQLPSPIGMIDLITYIREAQNIRNLDELNRWIRIVKHLDAIWLKHTADQVLSTIGKK